MTRPPLVIGLLCSVAIAAITALVIATGGVQASAAPTDTVPVPTPVPTVSSSPSPSASVRPLDWTWGD
jgi:hypothetical protein